MRTMQGLVALLLVVVGHGFGGSAAFLHHRRQLPNHRSTRTTDRLRSQATAAEVAPQAAEKKAELLSIIATLEEKGGSRGSNGAINVAQVQMTRRARARAWAHGAHVSYTTRTRTRARTHAHAHAHAHAHTRTP